MADEASFVKALEEERKRTQQHANDAVYYRNGCSKLLVALEKGVGKERLQKVLDEMYAGDLVFTVER
jgi:hypothetical protein